MFGGRYILEAFDVNPNQIADEYNLRRQSVYEWFKKEKIPQKRVEQLSEKFGVNQELFNRNLTKDEMREIDLIVTRSNNDKVIEVIESIMRNPNKDVTGEDLHNLIISLYRKMVLEEDSKENLVKKIQLTRKFLDLMIEDNHRNALWEVFDLLSQGIEEFEADLFKLVQKYENYL
ncbi:MAG TPA: hypothetical protein VEY70_19645 [Metabacillus sp.]|nr:hypothetical protein [Metabacillus sp.]